MSAFLRIVDWLGCRLFGRMFIGGNSIEEVLETGARLKRKGYRVTYNLLGEHETSPKRVEQAVRTAIELIERMDEANRGNVAIKPTLYGLEISYSYFYDNAKRIIEQAKSARVSVEFDAEQYHFIEHTFAAFSIFASRLEYRGFVRQCVQAHLKNLPELMTKYNLWDKPIRVVKGSGVYDERPDIIVEDSEEVLSQYKKVVWENVRQGQTPFAATVRDERIYEHFLKSYVVVIETLYSPLGRRLAKKRLDRGREVQIYIPFVDKRWCKDAWKDYGMRRSAMMRRLVWQEFKEMLGRTKIVSKQAIKLYFSPLLAVGSQATKILERGMKARFNARSGSRFLE